MRIGPEIGLSDYGMLNALGVVAGATPTWFTSNGCLIILGILAGLEIAATKNPDARAILNELDKYAKPIMAALTVMGVASAGDVAFAGSIIGAIESSGGSGLALALVPVLAAGLTWSMIPAAFSAAGTFAIATTRSFVMGLFIDADEDDDIGFQKRLSWGEDLWALFGLFFFILFPIIMLILIMITALNIITGVVMLVKNKTRDIAILRTVGTSRGSVMSIFLMIGALLGLTGALIGALLGVIVVLNIDVVINSISFVIQRDLFPPTVYGLDGLPAELNWFEVTFVTLWAMSMSMLVTIWPAWAAARLDPVEALRFE